MSNTTPLPPVNTPTQQPSSGGFWNDLKNIPGEAVKAVTDLPVVGKAIGTAMSWASKPLQEIQKDYKFIHSLYTDHGFGAGLLGTFGVLAGAGIGFVSGFGPEGLALGAEAGAALTRNILGRVTPAYQDSFNKSNDANYNVSFGRDLAHGLSNIPGFQALSKTNSGVGQVVSGIADAAFDFEGDPIATSGKFKASVKRGDYVAVARDDAGNLLRDTMGKPIAKASLPLATSGKGMENFFLSNSAVVHSPDQLDMVLANPMMGNVRRAISDIVDKAQDPATGKANIALTYGVKNGWSRNTIDAMSNVKPGEEGFHQVTQIMKEALYSKQLADAESDALGEFRLPSKTFAKTLSENWGLDRIRNSQQATTVSEERNLLLPARVPMKEVTTDEAGNAIVGPDGNPVMRNKIDASGNVMWQLSKPVWLSPKPDAVMNALSAKVRTFTNQVPLNLNTKTLELSNKEIDFSDPVAASKTIHDIAMLSLTRRQALEHTTKILTMTNDRDRLAALHTLNQEVIKGFGLGDTQAATILGDAKKALVGNEFENGNYGYTQKGNPIDKIEMLPEQGGSIKSMAIVQGQQYKGQMIDLKQLRDALRQTKAYGALYSKGDDFFTKYTNLVFAPLTLLSTAFGLRVSASEAIHQVIRRGLGSYISNVLATSLMRWDAKYKAFHPEAKTDVFKDADIDAIASTLTQTDLDALDAAEKTGVEKPIIETEITKELHQKEQDAKSAWQGMKQTIGSKESWNDAVNNVRDARYSVMPVGWTANKFLKSNLVPYSLRQKIQYMHEMRDSIGFAGTPSAVASAHQSSADLYTKEQIDMFTKSQGHSNIPGQELAGLTKTDPHHMDYWAKNVNMAAADLAQRDIALSYLRKMNNPTFKNLSTDEQFASLIDEQAMRIKNPNMYKDLRNKMDGYTKAVPESFAKAQVDYLQGLVHGADGTVHTDLINKIAKGESVTGRELRKKDITSSPVVVLGKRIQPTISDGLRRAEEFGFRNFVNPVMDHISRQPIFADFYVRRRITNQPLVDMGLLSPDQAVHKSALEASREMIPAIHSPAIRSQFAVLHRNLLPFFFAQEQAMRRTGRLIMSNPQAFRDFQIINQGLNNPGFVHTDANGQKYIVYPMVGEFGNALVRGLNALGMKQFTGLPESISGTTNSLLTVLPEVKVPSVGPFVNMGLGQLTKMFPWMDKLTNVATGGYPTTGLLQSIIPNSSMRDLWNAMTMDERQSAVYNSKMSAIMAAYYHGNLPDNYATLPPEQQQLYLDKIEHNAQSNLIIKGILSFFLPLSPSVTNDYVDKNLQSLRSEYLDLLKTKDPSTGKTYTAASALNKFLADNGQRAISYTVSHTTSGSNAYVPLSDQALAFINNNKNLINDPNYSIAAPYLIPQTASTPDALSIEKKLLANHFRSVQTTQGFMSSLYIQKGWQDVGPSYADYQAMLQQARQSGNKNAMYQIGQAWKQYIADYGLSNPIWYSDYNDPKRLENAQNAVSQLQVMNSKNLIPNTVEGNGIKELLASYADYHQQLQVNTLPGGKHSPGYSMVQDAWYTYLDNLSAQNPRLQSVITGVFRRAK